MTGVCACELSRVQLFVTPWTVARQVRLSRDFPGEDTGVGCHFLLQGIFPTQELNLQTHICCIASRFFTPEQPGKPILGRDSDLLLSVKDNMLAKLWRQ